LAGHVIPIYIEATAEETEARLLRGLQKQCPLLSEDGSLRDSLAELRRGRGIPSGKKVLIVLDQFEQWLHSKRDQEDAELVDTLRQCDGGRVQCLVMVRDDFWLAVSRFMQAMEIPLVEGQNSALADLFDIRHTKKVLAGFGRAFAALPESPGKIRNEQRAFLDQAAQGLAQEGKVVSVRLALFAEMMKGKPWTPASLKAVGGTKGVGVTFLEETFSAATAPPEHRYHQKAARGILKALLPESGTDIKGLMRSHQELLGASDYSSHPKDFDGLIRILDSELRLITPTDPEGRVEEGDSKSSVTLGSKYYQLTHDYLVHSLRDWLTRKQKETRRGRAELLLADRASVWNTRLENRQLPSVLQWASIRLLTKKKNWTNLQRKMMKRAGRHHFFRGCAVAIVLVLLSWGSYEGYGIMRARALVQTLITAETSDVSRIVNDLSWYNRWAAKDLREIVESSDDSKAQLHASLALLPRDASQVDYLYERLLTATPSQVSVIVGALEAQKAKLVERLWNVLEDTNRDADERLHAASALAAYTPDDPRWKKVGRDVVRKLVTENPLVLGRWIDALRPVSGFLETPLADIIQDEKSGEATKIAACEVMAAYAQFRELEKRMALPVPGSKYDEQQITVSKQKAYIAAALGRGTPPPGSKYDEQQITVSKQQADIAAALWRMNLYEKMREVLKQTPDPTVRSFLIQRVRPLAIDPKMIWRELRQEKDVSVRRALILSMGELDPERLASVERETMISQLAGWYRDDPDPGIHGAVEWLLRHWRRDAQVKTVTKEQATGKVEGNRLWYVTRQGYTMVLISGPVEFLAGDPLKLVRIEQSFAIAANEVTVEQFLHFRKDHQFHKETSPQDDCPVNSVTWYDAAAYCNWLSEQDGIPENQWCYEANTEKSFAAGMKIHLGRRGYRLPTELEWECACRAGSVMGYCFGEPQELFVRYGWSDANANTHAWPVGTLRPNDLGLFDVHGNLWQWCQDAFEPTMVIPDYSPDHRISSNHTMMKS
jgi:hypothetical protein